MSNRFSALKAAAALFFSTAALVIMLVFSCCISKNSNDSVTNRRKGTDNSPDAAATETAVFLRETYINGANVSGLTKSAARDIIHPKLELVKAEYRIKIEFGKDKSAACFINGAELTLKDDLEDVLSEALESGAGNYEATVKPVNDAKLRDCIDLVAKTVEREPVPAQILTHSAAASTELSVLKKNARFCLTAPEDGCRVARDAAAELICSGETQFVLPITVVPHSGAEPELPVLRAAFSTSFADGSLCAENRVHNISKGATLLDGSVLPAGQSFSCNAALGARSRENGWLPATAFANGGAETKQAYGGGICQVSTTLYNAVLRSDLEIVARSGHTRKVRYIGGGLDAALSGSDKDFIFRNNTDSDIYIFMWVDGTEKTLCCEIYGSPFPSDFDRIDTVSELVSTVAPSEPEFAVDPSLSPGECILKRKAITGRTYKTYRVYSLNGKTIRTVPIDETVYAMHPALYAVGAQQ